MHLRAERVTVTSLKDLCLRSIRKIADSKRAHTEGIDEDVLIRGCCLDFVDSSGLALRVSTQSLDSGLVRIPLWAIEMLASSGLFRHVSEGQESFFELSNPRLALALHEMRLGIDRHLRPLNDATRIVFACVVATIASIVVTMISRAFLAGFRLTLTQAPDAGFIAGWFQGVIGALVWGVFIAGGLSYRWLVLERRNPSQAKNPKWRATSWGALAGFLGGGLLTIALLYAQRPDSLYGAGWILVKGASPLTAFTTTGLGYTMLLFGTSLGIGCGLTAIRILIAPSWNTFAARNSRPTSLAETARILLAIFERTFAESCRVLFPSMAASALLFYGILEVIFKPPPITRLLGECISITLGGVGIVSGLLFGLFALRTGIAIPGQQHDYVNREKGASDPLPGLE